jgi:hypothetical protein
MTTEQPSLGADSPPADGVTAEPAAPGPPARIRPPVPGPSPGAAGTGRRTETPTRAAETPTRAAETPTRAAETPTRAAETPTRAAETPMRAAETPRRAAETPTPAETPTRAAETPTPAAETPAPAAETLAPAAETPADPAAVPVEHVGSAGALAGPGGSAETAVGPAQSPVGEDPRTRWAWRARRPTGPRRRWAWPARRPTDAGEGQTTPTDAPGAPGEGAEVRDEPAPAPDGAERRRRPLPTDRPPGVPPDPWTAFVTTPERAPGRIRRALRATGRSLIHEYALVIYGGLLLAVVLTWPTLRYPLHVLPQELGDPARQAWQIAWSGHILWTDPARLWQSNAYFPQRYSFAFGDSLLGYAPAGILGDGPLAAVLRYNILFVLAHALLVVGGYALVRQLGAGRTGATVAAVAFAYAPWRLAQEGHLDIVSAGGIPLALAMLARGHGWSLRHGLRPDRQHAGWAAGGWLVAAWQIGLGFSLGLPFAYVLGGIAVVAAIAMPIRHLRKRRQGPALGWRLLVTDLFGLLIVAGVGALIAIPYFKVADTGPSGTEIDFFSPPWRSLLIAPAESRIWGAAHAGPRSSLAWPAEMTLLPGFVLYALALVGLVFSVWKWWQRLLLLLGVAVSVVFTLGTTVFGGRWTYLPLFGHLPGSLGVRIPGRLMLWVTLLLAVLAAGAVAEFVRRAEHLSALRMPPWPGPWLRLATLVPLLLVLVESWNATPHQVVPARPAAMRTVTGPMLVLPSAAMSDQMVTLWSTSRFQQMANGGGGFASARQAELRQRVASFPDTTSVQYLRGLGIKTVVLLRGQAAGTAWERSGDVPVDALGIRREDLDNGTVVFRLS